MTRPSLASLAEQQEQLSAAVQTLQRERLRELELQPEYAEFAETAPVVVVAPWAGVVKALVGALVAGLGVLGTALTDGALTPAEAVGAVLAALVALGAVYASPPNAKPVDL